MPKTNPKYIFFPIITLLFIASNYPLYFGQFTGEDEAMQLWETYKIIDRFTAIDGIWNLKKFLFEISTTTHPPMRYFLSIPGLLLFPNSELGLRFMAIIFSFLFTLQAYFLGKELKDEKTGIIAALFIAVTGVYNWTSMAFAWSLIVFMLMLCVRILLKSNFDLSQKTERRNLIKINIYVFIAFTVNTGCALFVVSVGLLYLFYNYKKNFKYILYVFVPFAMIYSIYLSYFFYILPNYSELLLEHKYYGGQAEKHDSRFRDIGFGITPFYNNLLGINAYFLPYISWAIFGMTFYYLYKNYKSILFFLIIYIFGWSFIFKTDTQQYFILALIPVVPFFVSYIYKYKITNLHYIYILIAGMFIWNYYLFIRPYNAQSIPAYKTFAYDIIRRHNLVEPYGDLKQKMDSLLNNNDYLYTQDIDGSFSLFYYKNEILQFENKKYIHQSKISNENNNKVKYLITRTPKPELKLIKYFEGSELRVYERLIK